MGSQEPHARKAFGFRSLLISVLFHGLLALLLWSLVITVTKRESIALLGSIYRDAPNVSVQLPPQIPESFPPTEPEPLPETSEKSIAAIDALIAAALSTDGTDSPREPSSPVSSHDGPSVEFFGTRAKGTKFVFVMDVSYSMKARQGERFRRACDELIRAVSGLQPGQSYYVFLFSWSLDEMFYDTEIGFVPVQNGHVERLGNWIYDVTMGAGTDPRRALALARRMNPDAVFLLSDGQFNAPRSPLSESGWLDDLGNRLDMTVQEGVEAIYKGLPIHTIAFENPFTTGAMESIARATGGQFRYVRTQSLQPVDSQRFLTILRQLEQKHRHESNPARAYQSRLSLAWELIADGELLYAEYIMRPLRHAPPEYILNAALLTEVQNVLDNEIGKARLEDFQQPPELSQILTERNAEVSTAKD